MTDTVPAGRRVRRAAAIALATTLAVVLLAYAAASAIVWDRLTKVPGGCPASIAANTPAAFAVSGVADFDESPWLMPSPEDVSFPGRDPALTIRGWFIRAVDPAAPVVVLVHGHTACKRHHEVLLPAGMLHRNGYAVLLIDLRDHGDSTFEDGRYAGGTEEYRDVLAAWDWLRTAQGVPADRIGLLGVSLGAATVLIAAGEEAGVAATWEDSSYADIEVAIRAELTREHYPTFLERGGIFMARLLSGDDLAALSPIGGVRKMGSRPLFITHGTADQRLSVDYAHDLEAARRAAGGTVESWMVDGAGHVQAMALHPAEYEDRLVDFFDRTIGR
ncbi:MAG TPA: alpha/beta fold hydrolase [Candidatus Limnocylindrales bacterium]|jgi:dipeptidyl aminopeptidase/acylaminoacyl peptidase|nr:alpha/beta fold hydrolase [Candidatus Limnocylindrales bacterium]